MSDLPGRSYSSDDRAGPAEDEGWGSPVPAEYGSLRSLRAPSLPAEPPRDEPSPVEDRDHGHDRRRVTSILRKLQDVGEAILPSAATSPATTNGSSAAHTLDERPADRASATAAGSDRASATAAGSPAPAAADTTEAADTTAMPAAGAGTGAVPVSGGIPVTAGEAGIDPDALGPGLAPPEISLGHRRRRRGRRPTRIRSRAVIRHLDIMTVIRVSLIFWTVMLVALVVASVLLWTFADAFGSLPSIEKSVRTLFSLKSFKLHPSTIAEYTAAGGLVIAIAGTIANIVLALIYNLIADVVGGVRVELETFSNE